MQLGTKYSILMDVRDNGPITGISLAREGNYPNGSVYVILKRLQDANLVSSYQRIIKTRSGRPLRFWKITWFGKKRLESYGV